MHPGTRWNFPSLCNNCLAHKNCGKKLKKSKKSHTAIVVLAMLVLMLISQVAITH